MYNTMTVAWGSFGVMWNKPFAHVVVRPTRFTFEFMEKFDTFTLTGFPEKFRDALTLLGTKSGRDGDKISEAGLTPIAATKVAAPAFAEADLVVECRKIYWQDFDPGHFQDKSIDENYPLKDYHRIYFGEIISIQATERYSQPRKNEE
ncbi:hypothetical protein B6D60_10405 [candidate division KSB1 bacterium 4484_87]|nr:MAG: hypothetical protein B6D60_10405 [candidate division KSB1 bacterium 4484_87]